MQIDWLQLSPAVRVGLARLVAPLLDENSRLVDTVHQQEAEIRLLQERVRQLEAAVASRASGTTGAAQVPAPPVLLRRLTAKEWAAFRPYRATPEEARS